VKWLLWLYPPRWRRRYAEELLALIDQQGWSLRSALDVLRGAVDAWLHPELAASMAAPATAGAARPPRDSDCCSNVTASRRTCSSRPRRRMLQILLDGPSLPEK
jgi:hypothetical protein